MTTEVTNPTSDTILVTITTPAGDSLQVPLQDISKVTDALLAARKEGYEQLRAIKQAERAEKSAEKDAKKAESKEAKIAAAKALLEAEGLVVAPPKPAGRSGRRAAAKA
jgi:uncharacterized protein YggE